MEAKTGEDELKVEVRLFATLREYLPPGSDGASAQIDMPSGSSIADVLKKLGIPSGAAFLTLVDDRHEPSKKRKLHEGSVLSVWPPIAGGVP